MALVIHSILVLDKKAVGIRLRDGKEYYDVEVAKLKGAKASMLKGYKTQRLVESGNLLVTQEELETGIVVTDMSENLGFCNKVFHRIYSKYKESQTA